MTDIIDTTAETTAIVPVPGSGLVRLAAPTAEVVAAQREYQSVCRELLDASDIQGIGGKEFKKRSAWNKLAVAFGVSTTEVRVTHERDERGRITRTECVVRATAPNGRTSDGIGACDRYERCDERCDEPCHRFHFSNAQHDIPATAWTRASNRAKADLFGMGEVSAEEITGDGHIESRPGQTDRSEGRPLTGAITEPQKKAIYAISRKKGVNPPDLLDELSKAEASELIEKLNGLGA